MSDAHPHSSEPQPTPPYPAPPTDGWVPPSYGQPGPGQPPYAPPGYYPGPGYSGYQWGSMPPEAPGAQASMIVGIVGIALGFFTMGLGFVASPVAMVMGMRAKRRIDDSAGTLGGRGMAQAGFVLGLIGTVLLVLAILLVVGLVVLAFAGTSDTTFVVDTGTPA